MSTDAARLAALLDRAAIADLLARYARAVDARDLAAVASCFTADAVYEGSLGHGTIADAVAALERAMARYQRTLHLLGAPVIEVDGDRGRAETYCVAYHRTADATGPRDLTVGVHYRDDVVRHDGRWRICRRDVTTVWRCDDPVEEPDA